MKNICRSFEKSGTRRFSKVKSAFIIFTTAQRSILPESNNLRKKNYLRNIGSIFYNTYTLMNKYSENSENIKYKSDLFLWVRWSSSWSDFYQTAIKKSLSWQMTNFSLLIFNHLTTHFRGVFYINVPLDSESGCSLLRHSHAPLYWLVEHVIPSLPGLFKLSGLPLENSRSFEQLSKFENSGSCKLLSML